MNNETFKAVVTIEDFPSRPELISLLKQFIKENNHDSNYSCSHRSNVLTITFQDSVTSLLIYTYILLGRCIWFFKTFEH